MSIKAIKDRLDTRGDGFATVSPIAAFLFALIEDQKELKSKVSKHLSNTDENALLKGILADILKANLQAITAHAENITLKKSTVLSKKSGTAHPRCIESVVMGKHHIIVPDDDPSPPQGVYRK